MLRGIHKASSNWLGRVVMGVLLGLIAISFGIWGIGDIFRGFGQSTVAKVGDTEIRVEHFRQLYQDRLQQLSRQIGRPVTPDQARAFGLDRQLLAQVIAETVLDERAKDLGLGIPESDVARRVMEDPNFRGLTGQFDRSRFDYVIRQVGYTEARYLAEQRKALVRQQLVGTVGGDLEAPKMAAEALNRFQNEQRTVEFIRLDAQQAGDIPAPTPEQLMKYHEDHKVLFRAPEYRKVLLLTVTPETLASSFEVSDADLKKAYESRRASYVTPERRHVLQMQFPNAEEARAAAERIAKGETFKAIAEERKLAPADIDLGTVTKASMLDRAVADAAFALKEGEVSQPVQGRFGTVLVQVAKIEPQVTKALADVSGELKKQVAETRARAELLDMHDKVEDERLGGVNLTDIAKKLNLNLRTIEAVDRSGRDAAGKPVPDLPQGIELLTAVFSAEVGLDNDPLNLPKGGGHVWFEVAGSQPARDRTFDEVKADIETRWRNEQIAARLKAKAEDVLAKLKAGTPFNEVAASLNVKPEWRPGIKRGTAPAGIPARAVDLIFATPKDGFDMVDGPAATERIVFRVTEVTVPPLDPKSAEAKRILDTLNRAMSDDLVAQYVSRLESEVGVTINQPALNQVTGASSAN
jgi:peptidyl-prolyl cis-trans isomerase D